jgi:hypothetical protein
VYQTPAEQLIFRHPLPESALNGTLKASVTQSVAVAFPPKSRYPHYVILKLGG